MSRALPVLMSFALCLVFSPQSLAKKLSAESLYEQAGKIGQSEGELMRAYAQSGSRADKKKLEALRRQAMSVIAECSKTDDCDPALLVEVLAGSVAETNDVLWVDEEKTIASSSASELAPEGDVDGLPAAETKALNQINGQDLDRLIVQNEAVKAALAEWLTVHRVQLISSYEHYQYLRFLMWPEYEQAQLPEALLFAIIARESAGRVHSTSSAGASGLFQFMPATGQRFGLRYENGFDARLDPQRAALASTRYLHERFGELNGNLELALAAYNAGEGRIRRLVAKNPGKQFWDPEIYSQLSKETRDYVPYILSAALLFMHPEQYGLEFPENKTAATLMSLQAPTTINALSMCLGNGGTRYGFFRPLRNLNPRFQADQTLAVGTELLMPADAVQRYESNCVDGESAQLYASLMTASKPVVASDGRVGVRIHTVRSGETLAAISRKYRCGSPTKIARSNNLHSPYIIRPGQKLNVGVCSC